jgi:hypothetical protein
MDYRLCTQADIDGGLNRSLREGVAGSVATLLRFPHPCASSDDLPFSTAGILGNDLGVGFRKEEEYDER